MGVINHNAVLAVTWSAEVAVKIRGWIAAKQVEDKQLFLEHFAPMNGYTTFILCPDGSKEGWEESDRGDALRAAFLEHLGTYDNSDHSSPVEWIEVGFGEFGQKVLRGNCQNLHNDREYAI